MAYSQLTTFRQVVTGLSVAAMLFACGACDSSDSGSRVSGGADGGTIKIGTDATYPPFEYKENGQYTGFEIDTARAIGEVLGKDVEFVDVKFGAGVGALTANRFDALMIGGTVDGPDRQSQVLLVDMFTASAGLLVEAGNPKKLSDFASMCSRPIATFAGSSFEPALNRANNEKCPSNPMKILSLADAVGPYAAVQTGRADGAYGDYFQALYQAPKFKGQAVKVADGDSYLAAFSVKKDNVAMAQELAGGLQKIIDSGKLAEIAAS